MPSENIEVDFAAPVSGNLQKIEEVKDDVFSQKMLGDGFAIEPIDGKIVAPVNAKVESVMDTKHALTLKTKKGHLDILMHLGLDTVELKGAPFTVAVSQGDKVEKGQPLGTMDFQMITDKGYDDSCIVVYTNMDLVKLVTPIEKGTVQHSQKVQTVELN